MTTFYIANHVTQFDGSQYAGSNCTPTSGANGIRNVTGGAKNPTGSDIRKLVARSEETNPATPGWSLTDLDRAMTRYGIGFSWAKAQWSSVVARRAEGRYVVLQGDSDQFPNGTCSGAFDGDHAIGIHPQNAGANWLIDDPICKDHRSEAEVVLQRYARKLTGDAAVLFGWFHDKVPEAMKTIITNPDDVMLDLPSGTKILDRDGGSVILTLPAARTFRSPYQSTSPGGTAIRAIYWTVSNGPTELRACYLKDAKNIRQEPEASGGAERARWLTWKETYPK